MHAIAGIPSSRSSRARMIAVPSRIILNARAISASSTYRALDALTCRPAQPIVKVVAQKVGGTLVGRKHGAAPSAMRPQAATDDSNAVCVDRNEAGAALPAKGGKYGELERRDCPRENRAGPAFG